LTFKVLCNRFKKMKAAIAKKIIKVFGSRKNLAEKLGVSLSCVGNWLNGWSQCPTKKAIQIQKISGGKIKAIEIADYLKEFKN